jgi:hypothetical protein
MNNNQPTIVNFTIVRPEPNIVILVFPEQIIVLNQVTGQAFICPAGVFYDAAVDELQLGD